MTVSITLVNLMTTSIIKFGITIVSIVNVNIMTISITKSQAQWVKLGEHSLQSC